MKTNVSSRQKLLRLQEELKVGTPFCNQCWLHSSYSSVCCASTEEQFVLSHSSLPKLSIDTSDSCLRLQSLA